MAAWATRSPWSIVLNFIYIMYNTSRHTYRNKYKDNSVNLHLELQIETELSKNSSVCNLMLVKKWWKAFSFEHQYFQNANKALINKCTSLRKIQTILLGSIKVYLIKAPRITKLLSKLGELTLQFTKLHNNWKIYIKLYKY